jgi:hypothetical protein
MKLLLDIEDDKADFIMELLKSFSFVKITPMSSLKDDSNPMDIYEEKISIIRWICELNDINTIEKLLSIKAKTSK